MSFSKEPIYGNHLGIVINKNDPESRGRVQIWIPYLSNTLHANWNKELKNKQFKHIHDSGALTPELVEELKNVLPWAECASPIFGAGTSGTYNPVTGQTSTNPFDTFAGLKYNFNYNGPLGTPKFSGTASAAGLDADVQKRLAAFAGAFPDATITSARRTGVPKGGSPTSLHLIGRAIDIRTRDQDPETVRKMVEWWATVGGATEIGYELDKPGNPHLHIGFNPSGRLNPFSVGSTPAWWDGFASAFRSGNLKMQTQPAESTAGTYVDQHNRATGADATVKDASAPSTCGYSENLFNQVKLWEAGENGEYFRPVARGDGELVTVGYGTEAPPGTTMTEAQASEALRKDLNGRAATVCAALKAKGANLTQSQFDALVSYTFNRGPGGLNQLLNNSGNTWETIGPNMTKYWGSYEPAKEGLIKRRQRELNYANSDGASGSRIFSDADAMTAAIPGHNPIISNPSLAGSQPSGMLSIPEPGAKVFVFFLAGDIQKPIYFANSLEPETIRKLTQAASPYTTDVTNEVEHSIKTHLRSGTSFIDITNSQHVSLTDGTPFASNNASIGADGTELQLTGVQAGITSGGEIRNSARGMLITEGLGSSEKAFTDINKVAGRDFTIIAGEQNQEQFEAVKKLAEMTSQVQKEKIEKIESTAKSGTKVPCPLCSTSYAVDRASSFAKRVFSFFRNLIGNPPYFSYAIDVFQFLLGLILVPFTSVVPGHVLGKCGNPDCENGQIPSPQKPIQDANKEAAEKLAGKQNEVFEAEKKLGNGGNFSVAASKDVVISAGMVINDADCYTKTVKKSVPVATQTKGEEGNGQTVAQRLKSAKIDNVVYTAPSNLPGNLMLRGGNSVKIVAGSAGIELNTKGQLKLNCGSVEILSSDGEMVFGSKNHTTLKGKVVTIDADDRTNEGGVEIRSPNTICKGMSITGNAGIVGGLRLDGELSVPFLNTVGQRTQSEMGASPDQRIPFTTWANGPAQTNDILNTVRTALTHYAMPGALLNLTNIVKLVMQTYNTIYINTVIEPVPTGIYLGFCCNAAGPGVSWGLIWNWHHNQLEDPKPHHHDYTQPKGNYYDDVQGVRNSAVEPGPVPTKARSNGQGPDGGPKTLAGCGGFGGWGGGSGGSRYNYNKINSFGIGDKVDGFNGTRLKDNNVRFKRKPDGNIDIIVDNTKC